MGGVLRAKRFSTEFVDFVDGSMIPGKLRILHNRVDNIQILIVMPVESLKMDTLGSQGVSLLHAMCAVHIA